ncbi:MAG: sugar phosphate isomerase/epimerase, partial [Novosphingobium sp.]
MTGTFAFPLVSHVNLQAVLDKMTQTGVGIGNIEFFPVREGFDLEGYRKGLALGGELQAQRAVTHIHDDDDSRAIDALGRLCDMAAEYGLALGLEFMGLTPACNTAERAAWFVKQVGRSNIGIGADALHLARSGGTPTDIAALPAELFQYAQICDGKGHHVKAHYLDEAVDRMVPGKGEWPLLAFVEALPLATAIDVEVPMLSAQNQGITAHERARAAVMATRAL